MRFFLFILFFLLLGAFFIISTNSFSFSNPDSIDIFLVKYIGWFQKIFRNTADITADVIRQNWMP